MIIQVDFFFAFLVVQKALSFEKKLRRCFYRKKLSISFRKCYVQILHAIISRKNSLDKSVIKKLDFDLPMCLLL